MSQTEWRKGERKPRGFINSQEEGAKKSVALIQRCCDTISRKSPSNNRRIIKASSPQRQTTCVRSFGLASLSHVAHPRDIIKPFISRPRAPSWLVLGRVENYPPTFCRCILHGISLLPTYLPYSRDSSSDIIKPLYPSTLTTSPPRKHSPLPRLHSLLRRSSSASLEPSLLFSFSRRQPRTLVCRRRSRESLHSLSSASLVTSRRTRITFGWRWYVARTETIVPS